jgi:NADP-dependent 3-hydroxy acid dehydrogenase YdfG
VLRERAAGTVVVMSTESNTGPGNAVYAATKWGLTGWSEALRQELQPDVRVIVIVAQIIAFAVSRPRSVSLNEILIRPTVQTR